MKTVNFFVLLRHIYIYIYTYSWLWRRWQKQMLWFCTIKVGQTYLESGIKIHISAIPTPNSSWCIAWFYILIPFVQIFFQPRHIWSTLQTFKLKRVSRVPFCIHTRILMIMLLVAQKLARKQHYVVKPPFINSLLMLFCIIIIFNTIVVESSRPPSGFPFTVRRAYSGPSRHGHGH